MKNFRFWLAISLAFALIACGEKAAEAPSSEHLAYEVPAAAAPQPAAPSPAAPSPVAPAPVAPAPVVAAAVAPEHAPAPIIAPVPKLAPDETKHAKLKAKPKSPGASPALTQMYEIDGRPVLGDSLAEANKKTNFMKIKAELAADPIITTPGNPGDLRVWIGDPDFKANFPEGMLSTSAVIVTSVQPSSVRVTPNAPAFTVTPESICSKYDPTGTSVNFKLKPNIERAGKYRVGAGVWLYESNDCTGTPNPKDAADLQVEVVVKIIPDDIIKIIRDAISKFWAGLAGLIVALMLYFARNFLKRMFGFEAK